MHLRGGPSVRYAACFTMSPCAASTSTSTAPCSAPAARCCAAPTARSRLQGVRALQACDRAGAEVVLMSGRREATVAENARLFAQPAYIFEAGSCLVLDGEEHVAHRRLPAARRGRLDPRPDRGGGRAGAAARALRRAAGVPRPVASRARGLAPLPRPRRRRARPTRCSPSTATAALRLVDNGGVHRRSPDLVALDEVRAYHLVPRGASKGNAVARHMRARGFAPEEVIAVGDSREDMETARARRHVLVRRQRRRSATRRCARRSPAARTCASPRSRYGAGVYEAVVTTLAARLTPRQLAPTAAAPETPAADAGASAPAAARSCARARSSRRAAARRR